MWLHGLLRRLAGSPDSFRPQFDWLTAPSFPFLCYYVLWPSHDVRVGRNSLVGEYGIDCRVGWLDEWLAVHSAGPRVKPSSTSMLADPNSNIHRTSAPAFIPCCRPIWRPHAIRFCLFVCSLIFCLSVFLLTPPPPPPTSPPTSNRLVGLVVKASASRAEDPGFESRLRGDFFRGRVIPVT